MRKIIWCGMLGTMIGAAVSYLAAGYLGRHSGPKVTEDAELRPAGLACSPDELHAFDALLPDPAKLTADWQAFETIDLLNPQSKPEDLGKQPPFGLVPEELIPQGLVPANLIRAADEAECFPMMPYSDSKTPPALMVGPDRFPDRSEVGQDAEEQEAEPPVDAKTVEERLKRILQSYLQEGKFNGRAGVDTLEFRPSDAKKGEFDRIPF